MPTPKPHWSLCAWPGLAPLWQRGSWGGLAVAVGFTALANLLLVGELVWTEWMPARVRGVGWVALAAAWALAWLDNRADLRRRWAELSNGAAATPVDLDAQCDEWFSDAQRHYLAGDWVSTEQTLVKLLEQRPRDVEARLLLATLWRRERRYAAAQAELDRLELWEAAAPWRHEIARERELVCANCVENMPEQAATVPMPQADPVRQADDAPPTEHPANLTRAA